MKLPAGVHRVTAAIVAAAILMTIVGPTAALAGTPADDLKQIEYRYYFRGKYQQAIEALRTYLARVDVPSAEATRAREFLAASYVLAGAPGMGKDVFAGIIAANPEYPGPDPGVFKLDVMDVYAQARSDYAALMIKTAPQTAASPQPAAPAASSKDEDDRKPIYKKWWLYAGVAAVAIAVGAAASGGGGDSDARETGTIVVGVTVK